MMSTFSDKHSGVVSNRIFFLHSKKRNSFNIDFRFWFVWLPNAFFLFSTAHRWYGDIDLLLRPGGHSAVHQPAAVCVDRPPADLWPLEARRRQVHHGTVSDCCQMITSLSIFLKKKEHCRVKKVYIHYFCIIYSLLRFINVNLFLNIFSYYLSF